MKGEELPEPLATFPLNAKNFQPKGMNSSQMDGFSEVLAPV